MITKINIFFFSWGLTCTMLVHDKTSNVCSQSKYSQFDLNADFKVTIAINATTYYIYSTYFIFKRLVVVVFFPSAAF